MGLWELDCVVIGDVLAVGGQIEVHVAVEAPEGTWASSQGYLLLGVLPAYYFRDPVLVKFRGFWVELGVERAVKVE